MCYDRVCRNQFLYVKLASLVSNAGLRSLRRSALYDRSSLSLNTAWSASDEILFIMVSASYFVVVAEKYQGGTIVLSDWESKWSHITFLQEPLTDLLVWPSITRTSAACSGSRAAANAFPSTPWEALAAPPPCRVVRRHLFLLSRA